VVSIGSLFSVLVVNGVMEFPGFQGIQQGQKGQRSDQVVTLFVFEERVVTAVVSNGKQLFVLNTSISIFLFPFQPLTKKKHNGKEKKKKK